MIAPPSAGGGFILRHGCAVAAHISLTQDGRETLPGTSAWSDPVPAVPVSCKALAMLARAAAMRQAKADTLVVPERDYVQAIDRFLDGGPWEGACWAFNAGGVPVRLKQRGDNLEQDGVAIVSRNPIRLLDLPDGKRTARPLEARGLAAVAVRGDAGWYEGKPRRIRVPAI